MNRLSLDRRTQVINCLAEGNPIRSTERMTDTHRDTVMRLLVQVGTGCVQLLNERRRDLPCRRIQVDEIWAYSHISAGLCSQQPRCSDQKWKAPQIRAAQVQEPTKWALRPMSKAWTHDRLQACRAPTV